MSNIKNLIKNFVEEQLVQEDVRTKIKIIERIPNLSTDDKQKIIETLNEKSGLERVFSKQSGHIDLNKWKTLVMSDFNILFNESDPLKALKDLDKESDYVQVYGINAPGLLGVFIPLNWKASQVIASEKVGGTRGHWCIANSVDSDHWYNYTYGTGLASHKADSPSIFLIFVFKDNKYALQTCPKYTWITWDKNDNDSGDFDKIPGVDIREVLQKTVKLRNDVRELLDEDAPKFKLRDVVWFNHESSGEELGVISCINDETDPPTYDIDYNRRETINDSEVVEVNGNEYTPVSKRESNIIELTTGMEVMWEEYGLEVTGTIDEYEYDIDEEDEDTEIEVINEDGETVFVPIIDITYIRDLTGENIIWTEYNYINTHSHVEIETGDLIKDVNGLRETVESIEGYRYDCDCGETTVTYVPEANISLAD